MQNQPWFACNVRDRAAGSRASMRLIMTATFR